MEMLVGPYFAAVALLGAAGIVKLARPGPTRAALRSVRLPGTDGAVRVLGATELAVATAAVWPGGRVAAGAIAGCYAGFAAFVALALRRGGTLRSCGCFGKPDTPPTPVHVAVNVAAAVVAALVAAGTAPGLVVALSDQPLLGAPLIAATAACAWLAYLSVSLLPQVAAVPGGRSR